MLRMMRARVWADAAPSIALVVVSIAIRATLNFASGVMPKINSAYYLIQTRSIVESGHLAMPDTPLAFHLGALVSRGVGASAHGSPESNDAAVALGVALFDSGLPLLLGLAAYWLASVMGAQAWGRATAVGYACLSYPALVYCSDFQKNALGLAIVLVAIAGAALAVVRERPWGWVLAGCCLALCGMTHLGAFGAGLAACLAIAAVAGVRSRRLPVVVLAGTAILLGGVLAVALVPKLRIYASPDRLMAKLFAQPFLLNGRTGLDEPAKPPDLVHLGLVWFVAVSTLRLALGSVRSSTRPTDTFVAGASIGAIVLGFPLLGADVAGRVFLMASTPLVVAVAYLASLGPRPGRHPVLLVAVAVTILMDVPTLPRLAEPAIPLGSLGELRQMGRAVPETQGALLVARHGLEWWGAYVLRAQSARQDFQVRPDDWQRYQRVFFLRERGDRPRQDQFREVWFPPGAEIVFSGRYFELAWVAEPPEGGPPPGPGQRANPPST